MPNDNHINKFTAADIEKYHRGLLSHKEMHDLEKAALDDPFLADAIDGYANSGVDMTNDLADLTRKLATKTGEAKVIPLFKKEGRKFSPQLRVAVMIVILLTAGLLVYQFGFNNKKEPIAQAEPAKEKDTAVSSSKGAAPVDKNSLTIIPGIPAKDSSPKTETNKPDNTIVKNGSESSIQKDETATTNTKTSNDAEKLPPSVGSGTAPVIANAPTSQVNHQNVTEGKKEDREIAKEVQKAKTQQDAKDSDASGTLSDDMARNKSVTANNSRRADNQQQNSYNYFRGRVMDQSNNPVPFANITNTEDNVGTYTDAKGYFNLTSPDSILNVQVRSIGFDNSNTRLKNTLTSNQIVLQEDRSVNEVVISDKKPNATARSQNNNMKLEEPEPADGWDNYDVYLANNLVVPDDIKSKQSSGSVAVSFEVNKNGDPVNIKVEKSLCPQCDIEAKRLIKDGPKWKRKAKKRTVVTVAF